MTKVASLAVLATSACVAPLRGQGPASLQEPPAVDPGTVTALVPLLGGESGRAIADVPAWRRQGEGLRKQWLDYLGSLPVTKPPLKAAMPLYRMLGVTENLGWSNHRQGHRYPPAARSIAEQFLDGRLKP